ncbi:cation diffusion facilitator family transporter [Seinonella peptonophila]|uniref:cation diffusion facilitator family transporter n=1 Tax=Seinonella peptonophila TaxID=112248 RepID=UPI0009343F8C|nr:cation diffusion facilitator family transporter [Seinonella peptonophila]
MDSQKQREAQKGVWIGIVAYVLLATVKITMGYWSHSQVMVADGFNNSSDILLSVAILIGLMVSGQPADHDHHYGHHKAEYIATLVAASFMLLVTLQIWINALISFFQPSDVKIHPYAIYISILSALLMFCVAFYNFRLSRKTDSASLRAAAADNRGDAFVSLGAALGILGSRLGYAWIDPVAAIIVGILIVKTAWSIGKEAIHALMDGFDAKRLLEIEHHVEQIEGIGEVKAIRARQQGKYILVEMTVGVHPDLSVQESHELTERVERMLVESMQIRHIHIHVEPLQKHDQTS